MEKTKLSIGDYNANGEALIYDEKENLVAIVPDSDWANLIKCSVNCCIGNGYESFDTSNYYGNELYELVCKLENEQKL